ncbi:transketolase [Candidatus Woesebacteria bacterium RIFCSPHIGHO2_12_FULL_41_24]|uniref:Transketolase n=1 Tax=Candidatus Woesebacteria bacterium RIFCSPHIGHO2_12_FULL_41_24 TaxID=1802510 RepID=A0A1F8ATH7_9BACT|nr:MAG: transketolase [Candidatus Woesebacteria bacterium RBG_16_41_13]OGM55053.1 MAG: transketolase [Candidatus Woesebacteria bacterium RIFCSPHIGHO2_12_FULL_41_24]OGM71917.1 MAG: transketolase [Candidatus Woesebacteria bacterium RIFCSPLOWO2_02_FULL_42_10]
MNNLPELARLIRYYILIQTNTAQSGHTTSALSAVELMAALYFKYLRFDLDNLKDLNNDRIIFSKGHASPLFYALYAAAGKLAENDLLGYRSINSPLEGHPTKRFEYTEAMTGSLGQGLSIGLGMALGLKMKGFYDPKVYVLLGDGEMAEGQVWEAIEFASYKKLDNLIGIIDLNRLGQSQETMLGYDLEAYEKRISSFGWRTYIIADGHNLEEINSVYERAISESDRGTPAIIIAKTVKGKGVKFWEDQNGWHSKPVPVDKFAEAISGLGPVKKNLRGAINQPDKKRPAIPDSIKVQSAHIHPHESPEATKQAFGETIAALDATNPDLLVLDGDMQNSTRTDLFAGEHPDRFIQCFIAEQNMFCVAWGLSLIGFKPFVSTFACFLSRVHDQMRMADISGANILVNGSYGGASIGKDGESQMGLDDLAMFRTPMDSTVLYPSDAVSTQALVSKMMGAKGIVYIRTTREPTVDLYTADEEFHIGGSKTLRFSASDQATVVAAGITVGEALKAYDELKKEKILTRVIDLYSVKPIDKETLVKAAHDTQAIVTVEDHYIVGGVGDAVLEVLAENPVASVYKMGVTKPPHSGTPEDVMNLEGLTAKYIIEAVRKAVTHKNI